MKIKIIKHFYAGFFASLFLLSGVAISQQTQSFDNSEIDRLILDPEIVYEADVAGSSDSVYATDVIYDPDVIYEDDMPISSSTASQSPIPWADFFGFDTPFTSQMLDFQNRQGDKDLILLDHALTSPHANAAILGAQFRASGLLARTNRTDKFSYLGRFPTDFVGNTASDFRLLHANQNVALHLNRRFHGYFETLFSDVFSFQSFNQGSFQVRQAYVVFGDLQQSPFYAHIGKKNVSFGDFRSLSPFSQSMPWHYFAPLAEGAGVGYDDGRFNTTLTALNGSRGIRVADSEEKGHLNNFAVNSRVRVPIGNAQLDVGAGYLHGTIYNTAVAEHIDPNAFGPDNAAWDVNAHLRAGRWQFFGEYVQTVDAWPATNDEVIAYALEMAVDNPLFGVPGQSSISWSEGLQGPSGTEFEFNRQLVVGHRLNVSPNAFFTFEYVRSIGFAPLINIQTVSDSEVRQNSFVFGAVISL